MLSLGRLSICVLSVLPCVYMCEFLRACVCTCACVRVLSVCMCVRLWSVHDLFLE